jgi:hypothetical protein
MVDSGSGGKTDYIEMLKKKTYCVFGISATIMDVLVKEKVYLKNLILLKAPHNYKGISNNKIEISDTLSKDCHYSSKVNTNLFESVPDLEKFIDDYRRKPVYIGEPIGYNHPNICLFSITRCIEPCTKIQEDISIKFPEVATIVYNSNGISFAKGSKKIVDTKSSISDFLQTLKDNGGTIEYPHILIFSGDLAGRGISFVSKDYKWHLTDQMLLVADSADEPELIQKIRLCGKYDDNIPLHLYSTPKIIEDLKKSIIRQEEYIMECKKCKKEEKDEKDEKICKEVIQDKEMSKFKFTKRSMIKSDQKTVLNKVEENVGWAEEIYKGNELPPNEVLELYGFDVSEEERERFKSIHKDDDNDNIYVGVKDVSKQTKETYDLIHEYFRENYKSGWVQRTSISKYLQDRIDGLSVSRVNARFEHLIAKGNNVRKDGIVFKKNGSRWVVALINNE